jgi:CheY-like chemotaxis protein
LPQCFAELRRLLDARLHKHAGREYIQILRLLEAFALEEVAAAVEDALRLGAISFDAVRHLMLCRIERRPPRLDLDHWPHLPLATVSTTQALEALGISSLVATNGRDALEAAAKLLPDVVILCHHLPDMTGGELAAKIKRICPDTIVIMSSALPELPREDVEVLDAFIRKREVVRPLLSALQRLRLCPETFALSLNELRLMLRLGKRAGPRASPLPA